MIDSLLSIQQPNVRCYHIRIGPSVTVYWVSVGGSLPIRKYDRGSRFSCKTQSQ
jgi:hypothetical protein